MSRSWTTRAPRPGEPDDAYVFVDRPQFVDRAEDGGFLEWAEFNGHLYGTPVPDAPDDAVVILEIDVQGARQVKAQNPEALLIFIDAPSRAAQAERLRGRGDPPESVSRRVELAAAEVAAARDLDATWVINDDLDRAVQEVYELIEARR